MKHILTEEGSHHHVLFYVGDRTLCSEQDCDINKIPSKAQEPVKVGCEKESVNGADKTRQKGMCAVTRKVKSAVNRSAHRIPNSPSQVPR